MSNNARFLALALTGPLVIPMAAANTATAEGQADAAPEREPSTSTQPIPIVTMPVVEMGMHPKADSWEARAIARQAAEVAAEAKAKAARVAHSHALAVAAAHQKAVRAQAAIHAAQVAQKAQLAKETAASMAKAEAQRPATSIKLAPVTPAKSVPVATFSRANLFYTAKRYLGVPYVFGGASYNGIDCSGLVMVALRKFGIYVPHSAHAIAMRGRRIPTSQARLGDLVYYPGAGHIALWAGPGMQLEAAHPGTRVRIHSIWSSNTYIVRIIG